MHRRAAEALLASRDPQSELLAHHFTQSGQTERAIEWWGRAGDAALRRSAFQEAISHLGKAIKMVDRPEVKEAVTETQRAQLQADYAHAIFWSKGYSAEETNVAIAQVNEITREAGTAGERLLIHAQRWIGSLTQGDFRGARAAAMTFFRQAQEDGDAVSIAAARRHLGST